MSTATSRPPQSRTRAALAITAAILAVLVIAFFIFAGLYADVLWFDQLNFLEVLTTQWAALAVMFGVGFLGMALVVWLSIAIAYRSRPVYVKLNSQLDRYQQVVEPLRRLAMFGIPLVLGVFLGVSTASRWSTVLQYLYRTPFGQVDPQFGFDVSFYVYELPFYRGILAYASAILLVAGFAALATCYLYGGIRITGREVRVTRPARIQLAIMAALYLALQAASIWLDQYATLTEDESALHRRGVYRCQCGHPRAGDPGRHRRARRGARPRHRDHRTLAPAPHRHRPARRVEPGDRLDLPGDHPALPGRPERADARGGIHRSRARRRLGTRTASTTST